MKRKLLTLVLALLLAISLIPASVFADEPVTLKVLLVMHELTKDPSEIDLYRQIEEMANVKFEFTVVRSGWGEKKATMLASGDLPDMILSTGISDTDIAQNTEYFVPLNDYLDQMPNLTRVFEEAPELKAASTQLDGNIYSVPSQSFFGGESRGCTVINKEWLDKLGLEVPTTLEELKNVLIAFRDQDPNGNGIQDEIPMDMYGIDYASHYNILKHLGSWGMPSYNNQIFITDDGEIVMSYTTEQYKELVEYAADLWSENLINKESFTQDYTMFQANAQNPEIPLVGVTNGYSIANRVGTQWASQYVVCGPFALGDGTTPYYLTANNVGVNKGSIFTNCKDIEAAVRVLDACYDEKISVQMMLGSIGDTMTYEDGHYTMTTPTDGSDADRWKWINSIADNGPFYISRETQSRIDLLPDYLDRLEQSDFYKPYFRDSKVALYPAMAKMTADDANELALLNADIYNYVSNRFATWVTTGGVDEEWNNYLAQLDAMQIDRVREIYQNTYDNYMANAE